MVTRRNQKHQQSTTNVNWHVYNVSLPTRCGFNVPQTLSALLLPEGQGRSGHANSLRKPVQCIKENLCSRLCGPEFVPWLKTSTSCPQYILQTVHWHCADSPLFICTIFCRSSYLTYTPVCWSTGLSYACFSYGGKPGNHSTGIAKSRSGDITLMNSIYYL